MGRECTGMRGGSGITCMIGPDIKSNRLCLSVCTSCKHWSGVFNPIDKLSHWVRLSMGVHSPLSTSLFTKNMDQPVLELSCHTRKIHEAAATHWTLNLKLLTITLMKHCRDSISRKLMES